MPQAPTIAAQAGQRHRWVPSTAAQPSINSNVDNSSTSRYRGADSATPQTSSAPTSHVGAVVFELVLFPSLKTATDNHEMQARAVGDVYVCMFVAETVVVPAAFIPSRW
jgi:hypothetical protein